MIIVTGGAGFIGSNIVHGLNARGITDILVVDDLTDGRKCLNLNDARIYDYIDKDDFLERIQAGDEFGHIDAVFHQGACSSTTEWNGRFVMSVNYEYSKALLAWCAARRIAFLYASSASVYGMGPIFREAPEFERPLNMYAYSKHLFDGYLRSKRNDITSQVAGLRYFNVYGPREQHKDGMASVVFHFHNQINETGHVRLFEGSDDYAPGEQRRDFIHVNDIVSINLWLLDNPQISGIFNAGTGQARSFNDVANAVIDWCGKGSIEYIPFPEQLKGRYQSFTEADIDALRAAGYKDEFMSVETGVTHYLTWLAGR